jgi:hypothetical protein
MSTNCTRHTSRRLLAAWVIAMLAGALCSTRIAWGSLTPSSTDFWDIHQGSSVTNGSPTEFYSRTNNMFGGDSSDLLPGHIEHLNTIYKDFLPAGTVHFVEWQTAAPVTVRSFVLFAGHDGPPSRPNTTLERAITDFKLYAFDSANNTFDNLLYDFHPSNPYSSTPTPSGAILEFSGDDLALAANVPETTAQRFRAEFTQSSSQLAPRIIELDGFATAVPEPPAIALVATAAITAMGFATRRAG